VDHPLSTWRKSFTGNGDDGETSNCVEVAHILSSLLTGSRSGATPGCVEPARNPLTRPSTRDSDCIQPARNPLTQPRGLR
jgi:hypothetical protein